MDPMVVVAALAQTQGRLFLARRARGLNDGGLWELPGGKVEPGEDCFPALLRELREELDTGAMCVGEAVSYRISRGTREFLFVVFPVVFEGTPIPGAAHDACAWVAPCELDSYPLAPFDSGPVSDWLAGRCLHARQASAL